jgi:hypothetical protein
VQKTDIYAALDRDIAASRPIHDLHQGMTAAHENTGQNGKGSRQAPFAGMDSKRYGFRSSTFP